jgi:signal transduction histidine kinase
VAAAPTLAPARAAGRRRSLPVTVDADGIGGYLLDIQSAVSFCCLEALQNAAKHAAGASADVRLWESSGAARVARAALGGQGGQGGPAARQGHGYMRRADRLGAIGGCWFTSGYPSGA